MQIVGFYENVKFVFDVDRSRIKGGAYNLPNRPYVIKEWCDEMRLEANCDDTYVEFIYNVTSDYESIVYDRMKRIYYFLVISFETLNPMRYCFDEVFPDEKILPFIKGLF